MRKQFFGIGVLFLGFGIQASELASIMGKPSEVVTRDIVEEHLDLQGNSVVDNSTTYAFSIFYSYGVKSVTSIEILKNMSTSINLFEQAIELAVQKSPVVFTTIGPILSLCALLEAHPNTAFVIVSGNDAERLDPEQYPACAARNILRVAAFDHETISLMPYSNFGPLIRIAAPGKNILVENILGEEIRVSNTSVAAAQVAARLALFAAQEQALKGGALIESFLAAHTTRVASLENLVENARILRWADYY